MVSSDAAPSLRIERFHFAAKLNTVHFPLDMTEITSVLKDTGYRLMQPELSARNLPPGMRLLPLGQIAQSEDGERTFVLAPERAVLAVQGRELEKVLTDFIKVITVIREQFVADLDSKVAFYEFILEGYAKVGPSRNPIKEIAPLFKRNKLFRELGEVLGIPVTTFGFRLVERGRSPDEDSWSEFKIEPDIAKPKTAYFVSIVFRAPDCSRATQNAREAVSKAQGLLSILGRSGVS